VLRPEAIRRWLGPLAKMAQLACWARHDVRVPGVVTTPAGAPGQRGLADSLGVAAAA
jgi:hypothetical protein